MVIKEGKKSNRLINEKSPYLLQHAHNPVDWYPWGSEAFEKAKEENKPVFLSIGYSTCHWCHVMERECFEDEKVAAILNESFVSVKLDREERPDLDSIYMDACHALTGQGGWPLTIIMTPDKKPFFAGTYFPKDSRYGMPGLLDFLPKLSALWKEEREKVTRAGEELLEVISQEGREDDIDDSIPGVDIFDDAYNNLVSIYDNHYGGFGSSPKFPIPHNLMYLLRYSKRSGSEKALGMVTGTLESMARGGIFDQMGFGFHRYSTDRKWLVPHFEKMLYDQALIALTYLEAFQATDNVEFSVVAGQVFAYMMREMVSGEGGFFTAEDADSEGEEGLFYVWSLDEIYETVGKENGSIFCDAYGITEEGNFGRGRNILYRPRNLDDISVEKRISISDLQDILERSREQLLEKRSRRERPFRDEKIITSWNGLMIAAFARGAVVLKEPSYAEVAGKAAGFIQKNMFDSAGRLLRRYRDGDAAIPAFLDDYAFLVWGLTELYGAVFYDGYLEWALDLNDKMLELFENESGGLNYSAGEDDTELFTGRDARDGAIPSGNSVAALNLLKLGRMTRNHGLEEKGESIIRAFGRDLRKSPTAFTYLLCALDFAHGPAEEVVIAGKKDSEETRELCELVQQRFSPHTVILLNPSGEEGNSIREICPFLAQTDSRGEEARAYVCRNRSCLPPAGNPEQLKKLL